MEVGSVFDNRFEILARVGEGASGAVYRAKQLKSGEGFVAGREVALKLLDKRFEHDVVATKRFLREAKVASQLAHPNTVAIYDFGQAALGTLYIAMELLDGFTLHDELIELGPMDRTRICRIGAQLCDAAAAAHALSIVHRDLKLENIMVIDDDDRVKVLDFGLARSTVDPSMKATATGSIAGTPRYMPPEIVHRAEPTPAQDLYAIGVILGELALGRALWDAPSFPALFALKLEGNAEILAALPTWIRPLVGALLDKDPARRPAATTVRDELTRLLLPTAEPRTSFPLADASSSQPVPSLSLLAMNAASIQISAASIVPLDHVTQPEAPPRPPPSPPLSPASFEPPPDTSPPLELDPQWVAEKLAIQARAADDAIRARRRLVIGSIIGFTILIVTAIVIAIIAA